MNDENLTNNLVQSDPPEVANEIEEKVRRRAREKGSFIGHFFLFILGNLGLIIYDAAKDWGKWFFVPITIGWAIGLFIHFLSAYLFNGLIARYVERQTTNELEKMGKGK